MVKTILLLKTPSCSSCAKAVKIINEIKNEFGLSFSLKEVDVTKEPAYMQKYPIMSAPGIVIDGELAFMGYPGEKRLREALVQVH